MWTQANLMNQILSDACPSAVLDDGWHLFYIETHCVGWWIEAKAIKIDHQTTEYDIRKATSESI